MITEEALSGEKEASQRGIMEYMKRLPGRLLLIIGMVLLAVGSGVSSASAVAVAVPTLADALEASLAVTSGGTLPWFPQMVTTHDGIDAAQAGGITHGESSFMESTVTGPGTLSFWWKSSCENGYYFLRFSLDGVEQGALTGETEWRNMILPLGAGAHTLRWKYVKDGSGSAGSDTGWVDGLAVVSTGTFTITTMAGVEGKITPTAMVEYGVTVPVTVTPVPGITSQRSCWTVSPTGRVQ